MEKSHTMEKVVKWVLPGVYAINDCPQATDCNQHVAQSISKHTSNYLYQQMFLNFEKGQFLSTCSHLCFLFYYTVENENERWKIFFSESVTVYAEYVKMEFCVDI